MKSDIPETAPSHRKFSTADILFALVAGIMIAAIPITALFVLFAVLV
jgi:hypothetical protein